MYTTSRQSSPAAYGIVYVSPVLVDCRGMLLLLCGRGKCVCREFVWVWPHSEGGDVRTRTIEGLERDLTRAKEGCPE